MSDPTETHTAHQTDIRRFRISEPEQSPIRAYDGLHCVIIESDLDGEPKHLVRFADGFEGIAFADELHPRGES